MSGEPSRKKVLLTTIFRPFSVPDKYNTEGAERFLDYFSNRLTRESGLFSLHDNHPTVALYVLANNIEAHTTILETPSLEEYKAELEKGYDVLGITFLTLHFPKLVHMIALARKIAPQTRIVIGGFGTALYDLEDLDVAGISQKEGVSFLREFLDEVPDRPIEHPLLTFDVRLRLAVQAPQLGAKRCGIIVNGFGCPHACEFCSTSAYFGKRHVPFITTGDDLYDLMVRYDRELGVRDFIIYEEDFFLYRKQIDRFIERTRIDGAPFSYACYSTIFALSKYPLEELVKSGLSHVWIGVESEQSPFRKSTGRSVEELFAELNAHGVTTTGSIIAGLDFHKKDNLHQEFEHLASLFPSTVQISNLIAGPGTPLRARLESENRLIEGVDLKDSHLYSDTIAHPEFGRGELRELIFEGYEYIYQTLGPGLSRFLRTWFQGFETLRDSEDPRLRQRTEILRRRIQGVRPIFARTTGLLPNDGVRAEIRAALDRMEELLGPLDAAQTAYAEVVRQAFEEETARLEREGPHVYEPNLRRTEVRDGLFRPPPQPASGASPVVGLTA